MRTFAPALFVLFALGCGGTVNTPTEPTDSALVDTATDAGDSGTPTDSSADAPLDSSSVTADQACTDLASSICTRLDACSKVLVAIVYGDVDTCKKRVKIGCLPALTAPGSSSTPDRSEACAKDFLGGSCIDIFAKVTTPSCVPLPGAVVGGGACGEDAQCVSTFCAKTPGAAGCGVCAPMPKEGDACVNKQCGRALDCNSADKCYKPRQNGETCDATSSPCAASLSCYGGKCVAAAKAGEACDSAAKTAPICDASAGLGCNPVAKICQILVLAKAGDTCGFVPPDFKLCTAGAFCKTSGGLAGVCVAAAADGAPCDTAAGPQCVSPAVCSGGVCKLPDAAACK